MEINTTSHLTRLAQTKITIDEASQNRRSDQNPDTPEKEKTNTVQSPTKNDPNNLRTQEAPQANPVREAIQSLGNKPPEKNNVELFREKSVGTDVDDSKLNPQSIIELATSAFEKRQIEKSENKTPEQEQLKEKFVSEEPPNPIVDIST